MRKLTHRDFRGPNNFPPARCSFCFFSRKLFFDVDSIDFDTSIDQVDAARDRLDGRTRSQTSFCSIHIFFFFFSSSLLFSSLLLFLLLSFSHYLFSKDKFKCALDTREKLVNYKITILNVLGRQQDTLKISRLRKGTC